MKRTKEYYIQEARRHISNAREILRKYVAIAGHVAYRGVLIALNELMKQHGILKKTRKQVDDYRDFIAKIDRKILNYFNAAYNILHLDMGYDGIGDYELAKIGLQKAEEIIDWVEKKLK